MILLLFQRRGSQLRDVAVLLLLLSVAVADFLVHSLSGSTTQIVCVIVCGMNQLFSPTPFQSSLAAAAPMFMLIYSFRLTV